MLSNNRLALMWHIEQAVAYLAKEEPSLDTYTGINALGDKLKDFSSFKNDYLEYLGLVIAFQSLVDSLEVDMVDTVCHPLMLILADLVQQGIPERSALIVLNNMVSSEGLINSFKAIKNSMEDK